METIQDLIGTNFEEFFLKNFNGFEDHRQDKRTPDFYNPEYNFWVETKVGNIEWGVRLKDYQQNNFQDAKGEVLYFCGLHNFNHAMDRLKYEKESSRKAILKRNMSIVESYLIDRTIIEKVWEKENRINKEGTMNYCMMKRHIFRDLLLNRSFKRFGEKIPAADKYYGISRNEYSFDYFKDKPLKNFLTGLILQKEDSKAKNYLIEETFFTKPECY